MSYSIRKVNWNDLPRLKELLDAYMQETYQRAWSGTVRLLEQHGFGTEFAMSVAETADREVMAFVAWRFTYDLHHCMKGGEIMDLYVAPSHRGRGVALLLLTDVAVEIQEHGGTHLKGGAVDHAAVRRLYERCAMCFPGGECYVSGRAFRQLAELSGKSSREMVRDLPQTAWNYEP